MVGRSPDLNLPPRGDSKVGSIRGELQILDFRLEVKVVEDSAADEVCKDRSAICDCVRISNSGRGEESARPSSTDSNNVPCGERATLAIFFRCSKSNVKDLLLRARKSVSQIQSSYNPRGDWRT